eukprot:157974-Hanusia_phi.AAC.1
MAELQQVDFASNLVDHLLQICLCVHTPKAPAAARDLQALAPPSPPPEASVELPHVQEAFAGGVKPLEDLQIPQPPGVCLYLLMGVVSILS